MKNIITLLLFMALFSSCCRKAVPIRSVVTDSVRVETIIKHVEKIRDTTIYIRVSVEVKEVIRRDSSYLDTSLAESKAVIGKDGMLLHFLRNKPQEWPVEARVKDIDTAIAEAKETIRIEYKEVPVPIEKELSGFQKFLLWSGGISWGILIILSVYKFAKAKIL